jgi:hypothetical protein
MGGGDVRGGAFGRAWGPLGPGEKEESGGTNAI